MLIYTNQTSKRKPKKLNAKQRELKAEWESLLKKYEPKKVVKPQKQSLSDVYKLTTPVGRTTSSHIASRDTGGYATKKQSMTYTGDKMLGIGMMHKSNLVPVFKEEEAKDIASMRR